MKILAIRGQNLASLGAFDLDFAGGALGKAGLFAITGPTGSGKTTLLDALCVALFDRTPRLGGRSSVEVGRADEAENNRLGESDVRALLRRGAGSGFAEVDFTGRDRRVYRARWSVRRARLEASGRLQKQELELCDLESGRSLGGTKTETLGAIEAHLGLSFEQFRRSALLAQNDFAAFLQASRDQRSELLERMTGTRLYSALSIAAHHRAKEEARDLAALESMVAVHAVLDDAEREALEAARDEALCERDRLRARSEIATRAVTLHRDRRSAADAVVRAELELEAAKVANDEAAPQRAELEAVRAARERRGRVDAWDAASAALLEASADQDRAAESARQGEVAEEAARGAVATAETRRAEARERYVAGLESRAAELAARADAARAWLAEHRELAESVSELVAAGEGGAIEPADADLLDARRTDLEDALAETASACRRAEAQHREASFAATEARAIADRKRADADALVLPALRRRRDDAVERRENLRALRDAARAGGAARSAGDAARSAIAEAASAIKDATADVERLAGELRGHGVRLDEARGALDRAEHAAGFGQQRHALIDGEPCPLCGSDDHPWAADASPIEAMLIEQRDRVAALRAAGRELERERAAAEAARDAAAGRRAEHELRAAAADRDLDGARAAWREAVAALGELDVLDDPGAADTIDAVQRRFDALEIDIARLAGELRVAEAVERAAVAEEGRADLRRSDRDEAARAVELAAEQRVAARRALARCDAARVGLRRDAITAADRELAEISARLEGAATVGLAEDAAVDAARAKLRGAETAGVAARERLVASEAALADRRAERARHRDDLDRVLATLGCDEAALRARLALADDWIASRQAALDAASRRVAAAAGTVAECQRRVAELACAGDPELSLAAAEAEVARLGPELEALGERIAELGARLRTDDAARESRRELGASAAAQRARVKLYGSLAELIGSADGRKLRVFAQSLTLDALLASANLHLLELAPRYGLQRVPGHDLDLQVVDRDLGDEVRSVNSLSGGESFLVSLALALALSSLSARDVKVESLLVDEGFGSLDPHTLDTALSVLDALQATGRQVGLISHVPGLAERIGTRIQVIPRGGGKSDVRVAGAGL